MHKAPEDIVLFISKRAPTLWGLTLLTAIPPVIAVWLLSIAPAETTRADFGAPWIAWLWRIGLVLVSAVLFLTMAWLSGRYVLNAGKLADGRVRFAVWTLLGRRELLWPGSLADASHAEHRDSSGPMFRIRVLLRFLLRELIGRRYKLSQGGPVFHEGRTHIPGRVWVDAPYLSLHPVRGMTLIVDLQGEFPHGMDALLDAVAK